MNKLKLKNMYNLVLSPIDPERFIQRISEQVTANLSKAANLNIPPPSEPVINQLKQKDMLNLILSPFDPERLIQRISEQVTTNLLKAVNLNLLHPNEPVIKGIHELAKFLRCSPSRAQKLKNEGRLPYFQDGRTLFFDPSEVRKAMQMSTNKKG